MYLALANILDTYSDNQILLDKKAFEKMVEIAISQEADLVEYIKDISINPKDKSKTLASYDIEHKIIKVYLAYCYNVLSAEFLEKDYRHKNEELMLTILHEIRHANQSLIAFSPGNYIEQDIIRASILAQIDEEYYLNNSDICPLERMAEIDSLLQMAQVVKQSKLNNAHYYFSQADDLMHSGYPNNFKDSPTEKYIRNAMIDSYFTFSKAKLHEIKRYLAFEERLRLGLSVTKKEFNQEITSNELTRILRNRR